MANSDLLRKAGEALFGPRWQSDLARELKVTDRTVRRWADGEFEIPAGAWRDLRALVKERGEALAEVLRQLPR